MVGLRREAALKTPVPSRVRLLSLAHSKQLALGFQHMPLASGSFFGPVCSFCAGRTKCAGSKRNVDGHLILVLLLLSVLRLEGQ